LAIAGRSIAICIAFRTLMSLNGGRSFLGSMVKASELDAVSAKFPD
jgi:hypothetical protein